MIDKKKKLSFLKICLFSLVAITSINMGGGSKSNTALEPIPTKVDNNEANIVGVVIDDNTETRVEQLSFSGETSIGGIRREEDSAYIEIDLATTKELNITDKNYISKKFGEKEFIKVDRKLLDGSWQKNLLFPKNIIFSGYTITSSHQEGTGYAWYLREINKIVIDGKKNIIGNIE